MIFWSKEKVIIIAKDNTDHDDHDYVTMIIDIKRKYL